MRAEDTMAGAATPPVRDITHSLAASTKAAKEQAVAQGLRVDDDPNNVAPVVEEKPDTLLNIYPVYAVRGIFLIMACGALYFAKEFFLPVVIAFILALTLSPLVRFFSRRGIPAGLSALVIVLSMVLATLAVGLLIAAPVADWVDRAPQIGRQIESKMASIRDTMEGIRNAEEQVEEMTDAGDGNKVQTVTVKGPGLLTSAATSAMSTIVNLTVVAVLLAFLLGSGDMFYAKLVRTFDTLKDKKRALRIAHDVERVVSRYLLTITVINCCLGIVVGVGLYFLGMPTPYIFGGIAALVNFIPYVGALIGIGAAGAVAFVTYPDLGSVALVVGFYFMCTFIEGQAITPMVVGRRLALNTVAVFIAVAFWGWMWGIIGALIAVPVLVITKTVCDHFEELDTLGEFLSGRDPKPEEPAAPAEASPATT